MSLMIVIKALPEREIVPTNSDCRSVSSVMFSSSVIPMMPFMGVRISWLIFARNSDLAFSALFAFSTAFCISVTFVIVITRPPVEIGRLR